MSQRQLVEHPWHRRRTALKEAFTALMTADAANVADAIETLVGRLQQESASRKLTAKEQLVLRLNEQYPKASSLRTQTAHRAPVAIRSAFLSPTVLAGSSGRKLRYLSDGPCKFSDADSLLLHVLRMLGSSRHTS
jgi:hypothetical protein